MDEQRLERLAAKLGERAADRLDLDATAEGVLRRLRAEPEPVVWWRRPRVVRTLAAAALVVLAAGVLVTNRVTRAASEEGQVAQTEFFELESLTFAELEEVLDSLAYDRPVAEGSAASLDDLDERQLRQLLASMEG